MQRSYNVVYPKAEPPTCIISSSLTDPLSILKWSWYLEASELKIINSKESKNHKYLLSADFVEGSMLEPVHTMKRKNSSCCFQEELTC